MTISSVSSQNYNNMALLSSLIANQTLNTGSSTSNDSVLQNKQLGLLLTNIGNDLLDDGVSNNSYSQYQSSSDQTMQMFAQIFQQFSQMLTSMINVINKLSNDSTTQYNYDTSSNSSSSSPYSSYYNYDTSSNNSSSSPYSSYYNYDTSSNNSDYSSYDPYNDSYGYDV